MKSPDHKRLMKTLNQMVKQERWRKIPKAKGKIIEKKLTKSGNIRLELEKVTFYVLKRNQNLFADASKVNEGDVISVALRSSLGKSYCVKLTRVGRRLEEWV